MAFKNAPKLLFHCALEQNSFVDVNCFQSRSLCFFAAEFRVNSVLANNVMHHLFLCGTRVAVHSYSMRQPRANRARAFSLIHSFFVVISDRHRETSYSFNSAQYCRVYFLLLCLFSQLGLIAFASKSVLYFGIS